MKKSITCYLCNTPLVRKVNHSKDHVPPKCIFPDHLKHDLITVPCCIDCNKSHSETDELLLLLSGCSLNEMTTTEIKVKVLESVRKGGIRKAMPYILENKTVDQFGNAWMKWPPHMRETMARMAKGLLYKFYHIRNFDKAVFLQCCMNASARDLLLKENEGEKILRIERGSGIFRADIMLESDKGNIGCIWIQFFQGTVYYLAYANPCGFDSKLGA